MRGDVGIVSSVGIGVLLRVIISYLNVNHSKKFGEAHARFQGSQVPRFSRGVRGDMLT